MTIKILPAGSYLFPEECKEEIEEGYREYKRNFYIAIDSDTNEFYFVIYGFVIHGVDGYKYFSIYPIPHDRASYIERNPIFFNKKWSGDTRWKETAEGIAEAIHMIESEKKRISDNIEYQTIEEVMKNES